MSIIHMVGYYMIWYSTMNENKMYLEKVTLVSLSSIKIHETIRAMEYSMKRIRFADSILFTHELPNELPNSIRFVAVPKMKDVDDYNRIMLFELFKYIHTEYVLVIQWDGYVVNPDMWDQNFLDYDYIGAPWPSELDFRDANGRLCRVGNGVSLRSYRIMEYPDKAGLSWHTGENEDTFLCCIHRVEIEEAGMTIAPLDVACKFSHERPIPEIIGIRPFVFHKWDGNNVQYPRFGEGLVRETKRIIAKGLIRIDVYDKMHSFFRKICR